MPQQKHLNHPQQRDNYPGASQNSMTPICMQGAPSSTHSPTSYNLFLCHRASYCRPEKLQLHPNQSTEAAKKKKEDTSCVLEPDKVSTVGVTTPPRLMDEKAGEWSSGLLCLSTYSAFLLFMWKQKSDTHSGGVSRSVTLCGYSNLRFDCAYCPVLWICSVQWQILALKGEKNITLTL